MNFFSLNTVPKVITAAILAFLLQFYTANASQINQYLLSSPTPAPQIIFSDDGNTIHNLTDYKGKVVLLNFWATWCEPCVEEMPALANLAKYMKDKDVVVLPVSIDFKGINVVRQFYDEQKITNLPFLIDDHAKAFKEFKLQALPTSYVIDKKGNIIAKIMGAIDWNSNDTREFLLQAGK